MKFRASSAIATVLLVLAPGVSAPAFLEDWELDYEKMADTGQAVFDRVAPTSVKENYEVLTAGEIAGLFTTLQAALSGESLDSLAANAPQARQTLARLRADPKTQDYADWLEARMDYVDMAAEVERAIHSRQPALPHAPSSRRWTGSPIAGPIRPAPGTVTRPGSAIGVWRSST